MRRRDFIAGIAMGAWPLAARAQQPAIPVVGFLNSGSAAARVNFVTAFCRGLSEAGFAEGQDVLIEYRWGENQYDRMPSLAADLVSSRVAVIVATGGPPATLAAKAATTTIPIVFTTGDDPVRYGLVVSLSRPGGNITGVSFMGGALGAKQLELLRAMVPNAKAIAALVNLANSRTETSAGVEEAARAFGLGFQSVTATTDGDLDKAFATVVKERADALVVSTDPFYLSRREHIVTLAAHHRIPTIYFAREFVGVGGLMSYGASLLDAYRQVGVYTGRILKGEKPANLPVMQPTKFDMVINLKAAKTLGLTVPDKLLALADEVIE